MMNHPASLADHSALDAITRSLLWASAFLFAVLAVLVPISVADPRMLDGVSVWDKPIKFSVSLLIHFFTLAILAQQLPLVLRIGRTMQVVTFLAVAAVVFEILYICAQAMRGRRSHFNFETQIEIVLYQAMGVGAVLLIVLPFVMGLLLWRRVPDGGRALRRGTILGLMVSAVLTFAFAGYMSVNGSHWVGAAAGDETGLPLFGWSREVGDLRPAHFVATHLMQGLPVLGWLCDRAGLGRGFVVLGLVLGVALALALFAQALSGAPLLPL